MASQETICPNGGTVTLSASLEGSYSWYNGSDAGSIVIDAPGDYQLTVTNRCGYAAALTRTIEASSNPEITETATAPDCSDSANGCVEVLANGAAPEGITWTGPSTVTGNCNLTPGDYHYMFTDESNCVFEGTLAVVAPVALSAQAQSVLICAGTTISGDFSAAGGTAPYAFTLASGGNPELLQPGDYTVIVTDTNGCQAQTNFSIGQLPSVSLNGSVDSVCVGETSALSYFGSGGLLPYNYDWQGFNPATLPAGTYTFTITDGNECSDELTVTVGEFPLLIADISNFQNAIGGPNGWIELSIEEGEEPYSINWNNGDTTAVLDSIGQGTYTVTVTDANGCTASDSQAIIDLTVEELGQELSLFPNPVQTFVQLTLLHPMSVEVYDASGKLLIAGVYAPGKHSLDCTSWPAGVYYVHGLSAQTRTVRPLVKK
jgi:hypothetical protein